jgi:hypothetical protein
MGSNFNYNYTNTWTPDQSAALGMGAFWGAYAVLMVFFAIAMYVLMALPLMKIAQKTKGFEDKAWWAWVPILNLVLNYNMGGYSGWWMICPIGNIIVLILAWMKISVKCGKPDWFGILMLVSPLNIIIPFYLAYSSPDKK